MANLLEEYFNAWWREYACVHMPHKQIARDAFMEGIKLAEETQTSPIKEPEGAQSS